MKEDKDKRDAQGSKLYELIIGYTCNLNCLFCSTIPRKRLLNKSTEELMKDIYNAKQQGFKILGIGGGEPTLRRDLVKLVRFAKKLKFDVIRMETNAIMLSYYNLCKKLVDAGMDFFKISIHGHKPQIHDYLVGKEGAFLKALQAIDNLRKLDIRIEMSIVLTRTNYRFLPQYIDFFAQKGVSSFCIIFPEYAGNMAKNFKEIGIRITDVVDYVHEALDLIDSLGLDRGLVFNIPDCFMQGYEDHVVRRYNMKLVTPQMIINDADADIRMGKRKLKECIGCSYFAQCDGIWQNYLNIFGDNEFKKFKR